MLTLTSIKVSMFYTHDTNMSYMRTAASLSDLVLNVAQIERHSISHNATALTRKNKSRGNGEK